MSSLNGRNTILNPIMQQAAIQYAVKFKMDIATIMFYLRSQKAERDFICVICQRQFVNMGGVQQHMLIHLKIFECIICEDQFNDVRSLRRHLNKHMEKGIEIDMDAAMKIATEKCHEYLECSKNKLLFECCILENAVNKKNNLRKEHIFVNCGEREYTKIRGAKYKNGVVGGNGGGGKGGGGNGGSSSGGASSSGIFNTATGTIGGALYKMPYFAGGAFIMNVIDPGSGSVGACAASGVEKFCTLSECIEVEYLTSDENNVESVQQIEAVANVQEIEAVEMVEQQNADVDDDDEDKKVPFEEFVERFFELIEDD